MSISCNKVFSMTVLDSSCIVDTDSSLPSGTVNSVYGETLQASGTPPFTWALFAGSLPPGISLSSGGVLSGTPTTAGTYVFTVLVTDGTAQTCSKTFTLEIFPTCLAGGNNSPEELVWGQSTLLGTAQDIAITGSIAGAEGLFTLIAAANPHACCFETCGTGNARRDVTCTLCNPGPPSRQLVVSVTMSGIERVSTCVLTAPPQCTVASGQPNDCNLARNAVVRIGGVQAGEVQQIVGSNFQPGQTFNHFVVATAVMAPGTVKNIYVIMFVNQFRMDCSISVSWVDL